MNKIYPFIYNSREEYIEQNKSFDFYIFSFIAILSFGLIITGLFSLIISFSLATLFLLFGFGGFMGFFPTGCMTELIDELVERVNMKNTNYQPLKENTKELNNIVKLENGKLFRVYQFIKQESSGRDYVCYEIPKNAYILRNDELAEKSCLFSKLDDFKLGDILTPISKYYIDKEHRQKLKSDENYINKQSEINKNISKEEIDQLPLFNGLKYLQKDIKSEIDSYNKESEINLKQNQDIISKIDF
ncbi:hypothetical protein ACIGCI_12415 [Staphylococcus capitis]|uniref:hypothetical protein n=1 Tax=Staphylococcus capitis TaxID=29388 RepID=UPI0037D43D4C